MTISGKELSMVFACYCLGCFTSGYYWVRWRTGQDIRQRGSGNVGAKNVGRVLGPSGFLITLLLDAAKGALAVGAAQYFGFRPEIVILSMLAVVVGHNWPMQLRFHGGKGIAASLGAIAAYDSFIGLILVVLFVPVFIVLRSFTMSGLVAFAISPLLVFLCGLENMEVAGISLLAILILVAHRKNIREEFAKRSFGRAAKETPGPLDKGPES